MTGRGIDQIMASPCRAALHEPHVTSAEDYVRLAEVVHGPIPRRVDPSYIWGAALEELDIAQPDARIINLETAITHSEDYVPKGINYRMSPENAGCLAVARIGCCTLANNHILDWGSAGLSETLAVLSHLDIKTAGAGRNIEEASAPAILDLSAKGRVVVYAFASPTSGTSTDWAATRATSGVNFLVDLGEKAAERVADEIARTKTSRDIVVVSIHWGPNWGYTIPKEQQRFARLLIERADVSIVHGHSSHHPKAMEIYRHRLILYGCGDFLNDYEGIKGYEEFRPDLSLMYFVDVDAKSKNVADIDIKPLRMRKFRLSHVPKDDIDWMKELLNRQCAQFGTSFECANNRLSVLWPNVKSVSCS